MSTSKGPRSSLSKKHKHNRLATHIKAWAPTESTFEVDGESLQRHEIPSPFCKQPAVLTATWGRGVQEMTREALVAVATFKSATTP